MAKKKKKELERRLQPRQRWSRKEWMEFKKNLDSKAAALSEAFRATPVYQHKKEEEKRHAEAAARKRIARFEGIPI